MKKRILIVCTLLASLSLLAFAFRNRNEISSGQKEKRQTDSEQFYKIGSRYPHTITKEKLQKATAVSDIVPQSVESRWNLTFQTVTVAVFENGDEKFANGDDKEFNGGQLRLLQSVDYSSGFYIKTRSKNKYAGRGDIKMYYFTVVPEKEAEYTAGHEALMTYLKEYSKKITAGINEDKFRPYKISFTVTKEGTIANTHLISTSGDPSADKALIDLIKNMPGKWKPAENSEGEKIEQELVFFLGADAC